MINDNKRQASLAAAMARMTGVNYIASKIDHMRRNGIPAGVGLNRGAAPEWLITEQKDRVRKFGRL